MSKRTVRRTIILEWISLAREKRRFKSQATAFAGMRRSATAYHTAGSPHHGN
jgi:hypothetical protein